LGELFQFDKSGFVRLQMNLYAGNRDLMAVYPLLWQFPLTARQNGYCSISFPFIIIWVSLLPTKEGTMVSLA